MEAIIEKAKQFVKVNCSTESSGHDYHHAMRVYNMALYLAVGYDVDLNSVSLAAILHDLDDPKIVGDNSQLALGFLKEHVSLDYQKQVIDIINNMSYTSYLQGKRLSSLEGKIVQDADRLDALGAIGIARCFAFSGKNGHLIYDNSIDDKSAIAHFYQKLLNLDVLMNTTEAKIIANNRIEFMKNYLEQFFKEWR